MNVQTVSAARRRLSLIGATLLALAIAAPASALTYTREVYEGTDAGSYDDCGPTVDWTGSFGGRFSIRAGTGKDEAAFFAHDNFWFREVHVRESDGKVAIIEGNLNFKETKATRVDGSIFEFTAVFAGQVAMRDADGVLILRDRGVIIDTILFDTLGDETPGGVLIEFVSGSLHGQFPSFTTDAFCDYWNA